jgi:hypothetical protein
MRYKHVDELNGGGVDTLYEFFQKQIVKKKIQMN